MADFDAGSIEGRLELDRTPFTTGLRLARQQGQEFERGEYTARLDADTHPAEAKILAFRERQGHDDIEIPVNVNTAGADAELATTRAAASDAAGSQGMGGLLTAGLALGPALVPVLAVLTAGAGAFASALAAGGVGAIGFGLVAKTALGHITAAQKAIAKAQADYNAATTDQERAAALLAEKTAWDSLSGSERKAAHEIDGVKAAWAGFAHAMEPVVLGALLPWLHTAREGIGLLEPIIRPAARAIGGLGREAGQALGSPFWRQFAHFLGGEGGRAISTFGTVIGNIAHGLAAMAEVGAPVTHALERGLINISRGFAHFGSSDTFRAFIRYVVQNGPMVGHTLADIGSAFGKVVVALAPLGPPLLHIVDALAKLIAAHPDLAALGLGLLVLKGPLSSVTSGVSGLVGGLAGEEGLLPLLAASPELGIVAGIAAVVGVLVLAANSTQQGHELLASFWHFLTNDIGPALADFGRQVLSHIVGGFHGLSSSISQNAPQLRELGHAIATLTGHGKLLLLGLRPLLTSIDFFFKALSAGITVIGWTVRAVDGLIGVVKQVGGVFDGLPGHVASAAHAVAHWFGGLPGRIKGAIGDVGHLLYDVGSRIIDGLISGIKDATVGKLQSTLHWVTSKIPDWKGPLWKDAQLLVPTGHVIMDGLIKGLKDREKQLENQLSRVTNRLANIKSAAHSLATSISSNLIAAADITQAPTTNPLGLVTFLGQQDDQVRRLQRGLGILAKRGLDKHLIDQLAQGGLASLPQVLRLTTASQGTIHTLNVDERDFLRRARQIGASRADADYGDKIDALKAEVRTLHGDLHDVKQLLRKIEHEHPERTGAATGKALDGVARTARHGRG